MKNLVLGCTGVLASLHVFEWGWYLRYFGDTENGRVLGMALLLAAIALLLCSPELWYPFWLACITRK